MARKSVKPATESFDRRRKELLASIERERYKKRLQELSQQFEAVQDHLTRISKANDEYYKRRMALAVEKDTVQRGFRDALIKGTKMPKRAQKKKTWKRN